MFKGSIKIFVLIAMIFPLCFSFTISPDGQYSIINCSGDVNAATTPGTDREIFFYDGTTIIQLTNNDKTDRLPGINNNGEVFWIGFDGNDDEIFYYDGTTITQITKNDVSDAYYSFNDNGEIVWNSYSEIFYYDGTTTTQITNNDVVDASPFINNNGEIVWQRYDGNDFEIFYYDGTTITQLTDNDEDDSSPQINDSRQMVWRRNDEAGNTKNIFYYDGTTITQLTDNDYYVRSLKINNRGEVVWNSSNSPLFIIAENGENDSEIFIYDGTTITQLTDNEYDDWYPQINNIGEVVWFNRGNTLDDGAILFYDGANITQIATTIGGGYLYPQINDRGEVVWDDRLWDESVQKWNDEILYHDGITMTQITDNGYHDFGPRINNHGEMVWTGENLDPPSSGSGGSGGGGFGNIKPCFISTAAYGLRMSKEILRMALLFVSILIIFHNIRAKFKN